MRQFALTFMACLLGVCATAAAKPGTSTNSSPAPAGNSSVNQYIETIPTDHGNRPSNSLHASGNGKKHDSGSGTGGGGGGGGGVGGGGGTSGGTGAGSSNGAVSQSTQQALNAQGTDGKAAAAVAIGTAPTLFGGGQSSVSGEASSPAGSSNANGGSDGGSSALGSVASVLTGSASNGGMGPVLPVILAVVLIGSAGMAILRRRRQS